MIATEPRVAVIGGGINGAGAAWELARRGYEVVLFDKGICGAQTSSATTKMIHGGLRYLERMHVALVRESLRERAWLLEHLPQLVHPLEILLPLYDDSPRRRTTIATGLVLYDRLAGRAKIAAHQFLPAATVAARAPLRSDGLRGGFVYWDAQVDDFALVRSVVASAARDGATIREETRVDALRRDGDAWIVQTNRGDASRFDLIVNAAGPWMNELLRANGLAARYVLSLVRGGHLVLTRRISDTGLLLQSTTDRRVFFVLPWKETTLVGTTEVVQRESPDGVHASEEEIEYLIARYNRYFREPLPRADVASTFAGVRPLVGRAANPSAIGRDFRVVRDGNMVNVFGGKMTTFMALARKVALRVDNYFGRTRVAREPVFAVSLESRA
ncbi:MAG: glycerol-3-phosphate dehydrogenase/oxidase [Acidobacteria bacterium]|nr:glycerol-3-phosphate dehydrogenase/oxidase [Acidobacteriota bacterium]MBV9476176.1 glycerol-3-phosphate dehydrogenase/oxidase [Acidobacteriota bacterium]